MLGSPETFAATLIRLRTAARLSSADLALAAGLPRQTLSLLEQGKRQPTLATAIKLCRGLGVSLAVFDCLS